VLVHCYAFNGANVITNKLYTRRKKPKRMVAIERNVPLCALPDPSTMLGVKTAMLTSIRIQRLKCYDVSEATGLTG
jgi:hypothetical protein